MKLKNENKNNMVLFLSTFLITIFIVSLVNFFLLRSYFFKLSDYLSISRYFGVKDNYIIINLSLGFFVLLVIVFLISYPTSALVLKYYFNKAFDKNTIIKAHLVLFIFYFIEVFLLFGIQCKLKIRSLNKL